MAGPRSRSTPHQLPLGHLQPPRHYRTHSRHADRKNQPRGQAWHLLKGEVGLEMSWQLGQWIQLQGFKLIYLSCWMAQLLGMPTNSNLGLILWNKPWKAPKGESQKNLRARHHLSPYASAWPAQPHRKEKIFDCVCVNFPSPFFFLPSYTSCMKEQNWKSTTLTRLCRGCSIFWIRWEKERAVQGLAEVQSYCFLISRQPWGFLSFLV